MNGISPIPTPALPLKARDPYIFLYVATRQYCFTVFDSLSLPNKKGIVNRLCIDHLSSSDLNASAS